MMDERTWAGNNPLEVQAVEQQYLYLIVEDKFQLHKKSNQQK